MHSRLAAQNKVKPTSQETMTADSDIMLELDTVPLMGGCRGLQSAIIFVKNTLNNL